MGNTIKLSFTNHIRIKKLACLFAGLGHLQPLLLATTNANYLLDRFCMERCCSSEYISRIVTSIIFMEILSILVVRIVLYGALDSNFDDAKKLDENEKEGPYRRYFSIAILSLILLGYIQILCAFLSGGKKGHMHWFYASLLIQHFLNSLIAGSIGFWEVGLALWYLATLPMAPIVIFFYQLIIHSWIRNNGPRDLEYIVVECQIWLAITISCMATIYWIFGYVIPYKPVELVSTDPSTTTPPNSITKYTVTRTLKIYNVELTVTAGQTKKEITISAKNAGTVKVAIHSIVVELTGTTANPVTLYPGRVVTVESTQAAEQGGQSVEAKVEASVDADKKSVTITISTGASTPIYIDTGKIKPGDASSVTGAKITKIYLEHNGAIEVKKAEGDKGAVQDAEQNAPVVKGYTCYPKYGYYISGVQDSELWKSEWDGGLCKYAEYYKNNGGNPQLLKLHISGGDTNVRYFGKKTNWYKIDTADNFNKNLKELLATGTIQRIVGSTDATDPGYNTDFTKVLCEGWSWQYIFTWAFNTHSPTWFPLIMQGLSVGAVGSIFPNLIPKTLTCPKTTRTLSVINMFLVPLPHIFNVMLGDMDLLSRIGVGAPWDDTGHAWTYSLLLYLIYILAILFAIFNVHYPEWRLSTFLRNNTWMVFLMILFTDVLNETFNAISRAGICSQKAADGTPGQEKKNHPLNHLKT